MREYVKQFGEEHYKFVQFHPSYDYTDFVEGLRPVMNDKQEMQFVRLDGTFKAFCRKIVMENLVNLPALSSYTGILSQNSAQTAQPANTNGSDPKEEKIEEAADEQIKALYNALDDLAKNSNNQQLIPTPYYYFVIDEINRADLAKVFGELMFGLEESYRGIQNRFKTQYMNIPTYEIQNGTAQPMKFDCFRDGFYIPENLKIIGITINMIDFIDSVFVLQKLMKMNPIRIG